MCSDMFGSEFFRTVDLGQQYGTVSHFGGIVFIQFNNPLWCIILGVIRYTTLPSRPSYWTFTLVHYIRREAPPYFTMSAHLGLFHLVGFSCAWARTYYYFLVPADTWCLKTPAALLSDSLGPQNRAYPLCDLLKHFQENPRPARSPLLALTDLLKSLSLYNLVTTTTSTVVDYNLKFKLRAHPPALYLGLDR